jgi:predicted HicB family RNase H-like nuclease
MKPATKSVLKPTLVRLPPELLKQARHAAVERETSLQQIVIEALELYLKKGARK